MSRPTSGNKRCPCMSQRVCNLQALPVGEFLALEHGTEYAGYVAHAEADSPSHIESSAGESTAWMWSHAGGVLVSGQQAPCRAVKAPGSPLSTSTLQQYSSGTAQQPSSLAVAASSTLLGRGHVIVDTFASRMSHSHWRCNKRPTLKCRRPVGEGQAAARAGAGTGGGPADHLLHAGDAIQRCGPSGFSARSRLNCVGQRYTYLAHSWRLVLGVCTSCRKRSTHTAHTVVVPMTATVAVPDSHVRCVVLLQRCSACWRHTSCTGSML